MPRNTTYALTISEAAKADYYEGQIDTMLYNEVNEFEIEFVKRDGTPRTITGTFVEFCGAPGTSTRAVTLDLGDGMGYRSANTYNIVSIIAIGG